MEIVSITSWILHVTAVSNQFSYIYYIATEQLRSDARDADLDTEVTTRLQKWVRNSD